MFYGIQSKVVFVTTTELETKLLLKKMKEYGELKEILVEGLVCNIGMYCNFKIFHIQLPEQGSTGTNNAAIVLTKIFSKIHFEFAILLGTAFGRDMKNQSVGDVLIAKDIYNESCLSETNMFFSSNTLEKTNSKLKLMLQKFKGKSKDFNTEIGTFLCVPTVIKDSDFIKNLCQKHKPYAIGGDMESFGFASACESSGIHFWVVIKGISDFGDERILQQNRKLAMENVLTKIEKIFDSEDEIRELLTSNYPTLIDTINFEPTSMINSPMHIYEIIPCNNNDNNLISESTIVRVKKHDEIISNLKKNGVVNLTGLSFTGKTTMAYRISLDYSKYKYYNCKESSIKEIEQFFYNLYFNIDNYKDSLLIIDDISYYPTNSSLRRIIDNFLSIIQKYNVDVIIISNKKLPNFDTCVSVSKLTIEEVSEFLNLYNAPYLYQEQNKLFTLLGLSNYEISKLELLIKYMNYHQWNLSNKTIEQILNGEYCQSYNEEVQIKLLNELTPNAKELLYRISFTLEPITKKTILEIANIEPKIKNANELIVELNGVWIMEVEPNCYKISSAINLAIKDNVEDEISNKIYKILADTLLSKKSLTPYDAQNALLYLNSCKDYESVAYLYTNCLYSMIKNNVEYGSYIISSFWKDIELPKEMSNLNKISIRTMQIYYYTINNIDCTKTIDLTCELILGEKFPEILLLPIVGLILKSYTLFAYKIMQHIFKTRSIVNKRYINIADNLNSEFNKLDNKITIESLVIISTTLSNFSDFFEDWINLIMCMDSKNIENLLNCNVFFEDVNAKELFRKAMDEQWVHLDKSKDIDKICRLLSVYKKFLEFSKNINNEFLISITLKIILILECEYLDNRLESLEYFKSELNNLKNEEVVNGLFNSIGQQYWYVKKYEEAISWFEKTELICNNVYDISDNIWSKIMLCDCYHKTKTGKTIEVLSSVWRYVKDVNIHPNLKLMFYTEIMIQAYNDNLILDFADIYKESCELIFKYNLINKNYNLIRKFIHCYNYFFADVVNKNNCLIDNKDYIKPHIRIMLKEFPENRDIPEIDLIYQILKMGIELNVNIEDLDSVLYFVENFKHNFNDKPGYYFLFNEDVEKYLIFQDKYELSLKFCLNRLFSIYSFSSVKNYQMLSLESMRNLGKVENSNKLSESILNVWGISLLSHIIIKKYNNEDIKTCTDDLISIINENIVKTEEVNLFINVIKAISEGIYTFIFENMQFHNYLWLYYVNNFIISLGDLSDLSMVGQLNCLNTLLRDITKINVYSKIINLYLEKIKNMMNEKKVHFVDEIIILDAINRYDKNNNVKNLKQIYIEIFKQIGFDKINTDLIEWLK